MLRPGYIFENPSSQQEEKEVVDSTLEKINPKLRQFYEVKTKIEPFYGGGRLTVLSPSKFICQCGSTVKIISTSKAVRSGELIEDEEEEEEDEKEEALEMRDCFQVIRTFDCDMDEILTFDASAESSIMVTAHKSNLLRLWDLNEEETPLEPKKLIKSFHSTPIMNVAIGRGSGEAMKLNGDLVGEDSFSHLRWATAAGAVVKVWEFGGNQVSKAIHVDNIASVGLLKWETGSSGKQRLFAAERKIYVIDVTPDKQYKVAHVCDGHFSQVTGIEWPGDNLMISGGRDNVLILWDMSNFTRIKTVQLPGPVETTILVSPSELYLALSPSDVRLYNIEKQKLSSSNVLSIGKDETILSFYPFSDGADSQFWISTLASSLYQVVRSEPTVDKLEITKQFVGSLDEIFSVVLWSDMKVAVANNTNIIRVYNLENGSCRFLRGHTDIVLTLSVNKDKLVSGSKDNRIMIWSEDSDEPQVTLVGHIASVTSVCFHPLQMMIFSVAEDTFLKAWTETKCIQSAVAHTKEIHSVHCSPNGAMLVTASRDKTAKIWDADTLSLIGTLKGHKKSVWDAKFSSWDQLVVTASADTTLKIWNIPQFNCIKTLQGHLSSVLQATFINQGFQVLSTSSDGTLKSWDLRSSACISTYELSDDKIWAMDTVPDGSLVVTGSADSLLTVCIDVTEERYQESMEKRNKMVEDDQRLTNLLRKGEWMHAVKLAIELDRPFTLLKIIRDVSNLPDLSMVISSLPPEHKIQLMKYVKKWNTNSRTSTEAQIIMNIILTTCPPSELTYLQTYALLPFTQRHFQRVQKNLQQIALVKYLADNVIEA